MYWNMYCACTTDNIKLITWLLKYFDRKLCMYGLILIIIASVVLINVNSGLLIATIKWPWDVANNYVILNNHWIALNASSSYFYSSFMQITTSHFHKCSCCLYSWKPTCSNKVYIYLYTLTTKSTKDSNYHKIY